MVQDKENKKIVATKRIGDSEELEVPENPRAIKRASAKKVIYIQIDDEITAIYDRLKQLKIKNVYLVVPKRAILFQSIVNLKILKRTAEDLEKTIYIVTNDQNGTQLAKRLGMNVYNKLESKEHPSLVSGKFAEDQQSISPLKASVNTLDDDAPIRQTEKKFSISDLIRTGQKKGLSLIPKGLAANFSIGGNKLSKEDKKPKDKTKLVLVAPNRQALVSLVVVSVIILLTITYIALPGATIKLTPRSDVLSTSVNVVLADFEVNKSELDSHPQHEIASYVIATTIKRPLNYVATGQDFKGENAKGVVTVSNNSPNDWPLVIKTRFQTENGLVFRSLNPVNVPAQRDGKPGTVDVQVVADQVDAFNVVIGDRGNIGPSKFFLPALSAENQKKLSAASNTNMVGGKTITTKFISKADLDMAQKKMTDDLKSSAQAELQSIIKQRNEKEKLNLALLVDTNIAKAITVGEPKISIEPNLENQKRDSFTVQGEVAVVGTAYNLDELMAILRSELKRNQNPEKRLVHIDENSLTYRIVENDQVNKKIKITATIKGIEEFEISPDKENGDRLLKTIRDHVTGKQVRDARDYILNLPEVSKATIDSWPAWTPVMPNIPENIKVEIVRDEATDNVGN